MAALKTKQTEASVEAYLDTIEDPRRRADCAAMSALLKKVTKCEPRMWRPSIVGFGTAASDPAECGDKWQSSIRVWLDPEMTRATRFAVLQQEHPESDMPLTGTIVGEHLYSVAGIMAYQTRDGRWVRVGNVSMFEE